MSTLPPKNLFECLVELTRTFLALYRSMDRHMRSNVMPHLDEPARSIVWNLIAHIQEEDAVHPDLLVYLDTTIVEIRKAIAAGKNVKQVPVPRERLIGCSQAFDTDTAYTPAAVALRVALPPLERLFQAAREAHEFAEAIRLGYKLVDMK
jgi:hypothetical protein